jgi:hypothetical protein
MFKGMGLKVWRRSHLKWYDLPTEFNKSALIGSKIIKGTLADSMVIS